MVRRKGMFGEIQVIDRGYERALYLNGQKQGGAYLRPSASIVAPDLPKDEPGPICSSVYALGWLAAGCMQPNGTGLMIGLGSGAGAVELLYNFPWVDLTVVEIDPVMAQVAIGSFPLLVYYMNTGRLHIVIEDADEFLANNYDDWDFGLADAYSGGNALLDGYMPRLCERCSEVYVNVIDRLHGPSMQAVAEMMYAMDRPVSEVFKASQSLSPELYSGMSNWILTSETPDIALLGMFEPFKGVDDSHAHGRRMAWDNLLSSALSAVT